MTEQNTDRAVFTEIFVIIGSKKYLYADIDENHSLVKDKLSFRLGVMIGHQSALKETKKTA